MTLSKWNEFIDICNSFNKEIITEFKDYIPKSKILIQCNKCNSSFERGINHFQKYEYKCPFCELKRTNESGNYKLTLSSFLDKAKETHSDKYDYSLVEYNGYEKKINIVCKEHGVFEQTPHHHLDGQGCKLCGYIQNGKKRNLGIEQFIIKAKEIHGLKYDYSESEYVGTKIDIKIYCKECKEIFYQKPNYHLSGNGCPRCFYKGTSNEEKDLINFIKNETDLYIEERNRSIITPKELDIFLPNKNIAIEYNGLFWHSEDKVGKNNHITKTISCQDKQIQLIHIFSDEWNLRKDIVKSMILNKLGMSKKIHARQCSLIEISYQEGSKFFEKNHISGDNKAQKYFALQFEDTIVACLSYKKPIQKKYGNVIEIARFANILNHIVIGGFQKLLKFSEKWIRDEQYDGILTYADLRFGIGNVYHKANFELIGRTNPDYWYSNGIIRENRFKYRAQNGKSEEQIANDAKVYKVYGCGSNIYLKKF